MKIECPSCRFSAVVDSSRIPPNGANAKCPRCSNVFFVTKEEPLPSSAEPKKIVCPKCEAEQDEAESCGLCGLVFQKYPAADDPPTTAAVVSSGEPLPRAEQAPPTESATPTPAEAAGLFSFGKGRDEIFAWTGQGLISKDNLPRALRIAGALPTSTSWRAFLDALALWLSVVFLTAAVILFFAYNWQTLGHFIKFGIVESLLAGAILASWRLGLERTSGKAALLAATLLVGALLALVGQTYQTGADSFELFFVWALLVLPWVAISRFAPLWLVLIALVNLAVGLYFTTFAGMWGVFVGTGGLWWFLALLNSAALVAWELAADRVPYLADRWAPRALATVAAGFITLLAVWGIIGNDGTGFEFCGYSVWLACAYAAYRRRIPDLYVLALGVLSLVVVATVFLAHYTMRGMDAGSFLFIGVVVLGMAATGSWWLRMVAREVEA